LYCYAYQKVIDSLFFLSLGGAIACQLIVQRVISPNANPNTPEGLAIYNLFDHIVPYTTAFMATATVSLVTMLIMKLKESKDRK
jgi:hypothetical protein